MKIHFPSNLYRYASITLAGTLTTGAILFSPDLQRLQVLRTALLLPILMPIAMISPPPPYISL